MEKVKLPKEIAKMVAELQEIELDVGEVYEEVIGRYSIRPEFIMSALVNGYEVEKSPEEKLREYYQTADSRRKHSVRIGDRSAESRYAGRMQAVETALTILGITIEGING